MRRRKGEASNKAKRTIVHLNPCLFQAGTLELEKLSLFYLTCQIGDSWDCNFRHLGKKYLYRVTCVLCYLVGLTLVCLLHCLPSSACAGGSLEGLAGQLDNMAEKPNQSTLVTLQYCRIWVAAGKKESKTNFTNCNLRGNATVVEQE